MDPKLVIATAPFVKGKVETPAVMRHVMYSLVPAVVAAAWLFGVSALLVIAASIAGAVVMEWIVQRGKGTILDGSAILTGLLLALTLPPGFPLWMAFLGAMFGIGFGKVIFGGFGQNVFNPSLVGRAFLQAAFPVAITTFAMPGEFFALRGDNFAIPFLKAQFDAVSSATPLARMKFDHASTPIAKLFLGTTSGSLGETSALAILLGGAYLAARRFLNWRIPLAIFLATIAFSGALYLAAPAKYPTPVFHLLSGGLMLGAIYMATDPVTSPSTHRGCWIFGAGIGILVVAIRQFGGLPEGVMYAILIMNAAAPLLTRVTQPRIYGSKA